MSGTLPNWIARLLGEEVAPGEGTAFRMQFEWPLGSAWGACLLAAVAVGFVVAIYLRENRRASVAYRMMLAAVRFSLVAVVLLMISQVSLSLQRTGLPYVVVVVDVTGSMNSTDRYDDALRAGLQQRLDELGGGELTRWNLTRMLLTEDNAALPRQVGKDYRLRVYFLDNSPRGVELSEATDVDGLIAEIKAIRTPKAGATRLGAAVRTVLDDLRGTPPAAIVLLTDGLNTDGPPLSDAVAAARSKGVPLSAVGIGSEQPQRDLELTDLSVDPVVFVDDVVNFEFRVSCTDFEYGRVQVVLRREGDTEILARTEVFLGGDRPSVQHQLTHRPERTGSFRYIVEVLPQEGDVDTANNRQTRPVEVRDEKIRVLLAWAYPSYEFRYLWNLLHRDDSIEVYTVLQDADVEVVRRQIDMDAQQQKQMLRAFPVQRGELFEQDVIILGDVNPARLSESMMQNLVDFVDRPVDREGKGGSLILVAGMKYMPHAFRGTRLADLMPIDPQSVRIPDPEQPITDGFQVQVTAAGLARPPMQLGDTQLATRTAWRGLPPLYWLMDAPDRKPGTVVLAEHPTRRDAEGRLLPVICMHNPGAGTVVFHATDETHRWRYRVGDAFFARYWVQMIRHLARSKLAGRSDGLQLQSDRQTYRAGDPVRLRVRFDDPRAAPGDDDGVTVVLDHADSRTRREPLHRASSRGVFEAELDDLAPGDYHAWVAAPSSKGRVAWADFVVEPPAGEREGEPINAAGLQKAADDTGGKYYRLEEAGGLLDDLPPGIQVPTEPLPRKPLWNRWPVLVLFLLLLIGEWILRKRGGMI